jgi:hypothetical protein
VFFWRRWAQAIGGKFHEWAVQKSAELDIKRRARESGRNNLPHTCDVDLDVVQQQIVDTYGSGANSLSQALWNRLRGALDQIEDRIPKPLEPESIIARKAYDLAQIHSSARDDLVARCHDERESWRDLKLFKGEHELARSASYPRSRPPIFVIAVILSALAIESILNGMIFREVSASYTVGGIVQALAFSVVNVSLGYFVLGLAAARYSVHSVPWKRRLGFAGIGLAILLGLIWNLYVAHYREQAGDLYRQFLTTGSLDALRGMLINAGEHLLRSPFDLPSWQALVLLVVGVLIFFALGVEGYQGWDDVYPGYGTVDRRHKDGRRAYENGVRGLRERMRFSLDGAVLEVKGKMAADERAVAEVREIESEALQAINEAEDSAADLARSCVENLRDYREANAYVRTNDPPTYFKAYPELKIPELRDPDIPQKISRAVESAENAFHANQAQKTIFDKLLHELTERAEADLSDFLKEIWKEAIFRANQERKQECEEAPEPASPPEQGPGPEGAPPRGKQ